jgi:hypothetical protein
MRVTTITLAVAAFALLAGCASEPWVKPYERERLADPAMNFVREPLAARHRAHVQEVREAGRGGGVAQGGGCGCN